MRVVVKNCQRGRRYTAACPVSIPLKDLLGEEWPITAHHRLKRQGVQGGFSKARMTRDTPSTQKRPRKGQWMAGILQREANSEAKDFSLRRFDVASAASGPRWAFSAATYGGGGSIASNGVDRSERRSPQVLLRSPGPPTRCTLCSWDGGRNGCGNAGGYTAEVGGCNANQRGW